jgi:hypothetical protein
MQRVDRLAHPSSALEWGDPLLACTPADISIHQLAVRTQELTAAVRDLALELKKLAGEVDELRATEHPSHLGERY